MSIRIEVGEVGIAIWATGRVRILASKLNTILTQVGPFLLAYELHRRIDPNVAIEEKYAALVCFRQPIQKPC